MTTPRAPESATAARRTRVAAPLLGLVAALALSAWVLYAPAIDHHDAAREDTHRALTAMRSAIVRSRPGSPVFIKPLPSPPAQFPGWAAAFVIFHPDNGTLDGRRIYFVEKDAGVLAAARRGRRIATLFMTPEQWAAQRAATAGAQ